MTKPWWAWLLALWTAIVPSPMPSDHSRLPIITAAADLAAHDGELVVLIGRYRAYAVAWKVGEPPRQLGHAAVWVGDQAIRLGETVRPEKARQELAGEMVAATGTLHLHPVPGHGSDVAPSDLGPILDLSEPIHPFESH